MSLLAYHWTTADLEIGSTYSTSAWEASRYWTGILEGDHTGAVSGPLKALQGLLETPIFAVSAPGAAKALEDVLLSGKYAAQVLVEYVFEEVRLEIDPTLPSRRRCLFCFDRAAAPTTYARRFGWDVDSYRLYELELAAPPGRLHRGVLGQLDGQLGKVPDHRARAQLYWTDRPQDAAPQDVEILYEGEFRIVRELMIGER